MARLDLFTCDRCGTVLGPGQREGHVLQLDIDETRTPPKKKSGPEVVTPLTRRVDLCVGCMTRVVKYLVTGMGFEARRQLLDYAVKPDREMTNGR